MKNYNIQAIRHVRWCEVDVENREVDHNVQIPQFDVPASSFDECKTKAKEILATVRVSDVSVTYDVQVADGDTVQSWKW